MLLSKLFTNKKYSQQNENSQVKSSVLLQKGGYVFCYNDSVYALLPLGLRVIENIKKIIRQEFSFFDGQELLLPFTVPFDLIERGGRYHLLHDQMVTFSDHHKRKYYLATHHLETMLESVGSSLLSVADLPLFCYQFQLKFRDERKKGEGLLRSKEFLVSDAYSFHPSESSLNNFFPKVYAMFKRLFERCRVDAIAEEESLGVVSGEKAYGFIIKSRYGDSEIIYCPECGYQVNSDIATGVKVYANSPLRPMSVVKLNNESTTDRQITESLDIDPAQLIKVRYYVGKKGYVMALISSIYQISHFKLARHLKMWDLVAVDEAELVKDRLCSSLVFDISLVNDLDKPLHIIADTTVANSSNMAMAAEHDRYYLNVTHSRDFEAQYVADIALINTAVDYCQLCGGAFESFRAIELGNMLKLNHKSNFFANISITGKKGDTHPTLGLYDIGITRLMAAVVEQNCDRRGINWPFELAPYKFSLIGIGKSQRLKKIIDAIHKKHRDELLLDDREISFADKLRDSDLIGIPYRIVISISLLEKENAEFYERSSGRRWRVAIREIDQEIVKLAAIHRQLTASK